MNEAHALPTGLVYFLDYTMSPRRGDPCGRPVWACSRRDDPAPTRRPTKKLGVQKG